MKVLYTDNHLLVVDKPPDIATMGAETGKESVHQWASQWIKDRYQKPGNVFVGIVSRLDQLTSGVLVLARTSKSASRLSLQFGGPGKKTGKNKEVSRRAEKLYLAIVQGNLEKDSGLPRSGSLVDEVFKDDSAHRMRVARSSREDAKQARLDYHVIGFDGKNSFLAVRLHTGRKHQIRLQLADRGHAILGDTKYGSKVPFPRGVALHSWQLLITHPTKAELMRFVASIPRQWHQVFASIPDQPKIESMLVQPLEWSVETPVTRSD